MITETLIDGLTVGDVTHTEVELRPLSVGDVLDATEAAERAVATPEGWVLLTSDSRMGAEILRRQIARVGDHKGPLSMTELRKLSNRDLSVLKIAVAKVNTARANVAELSARGRGGGAGEPA